MATDNLEDGTLVIFFYEESKRYKLAKIHCTEDDHYEIYAYLGNFTEDYVDLKKDDKGETWWVYSEDWEWFRAYAWIRDSKERRINKIRLPKDLDLDQHDCKGKGGFRYADVTINELQYEFCFHDVYFTLKRDGETTASPPKTKSSKLKRDRGARDGETNDSATETPGDARTLFQSPELDPKLDDLAKLKTPKDFKETGVPILINIAATIGMPMDAPKDIKPALKEIAELFSSRAEEDETLECHRLHMKHGAKCLVENVMAHLKFDKELEKTNISPDSTAGIFVETKFQDGIKQIMDKNGRPFSGRGCTEPGNAIGVKVIFKKLRDTECTKAITEAWRDMHGFDEGRFNKVIDILNNSGVKLYAQMCDALLHSLKCALNFPDGYTFKDKQKGAETFTNASGARVRQQSNMASGKCALGVRFLPEQVQQAD